MAKNNVKNTRETRDYYVGVRFKKNEYETLIHNMETAGYLSLSKFIRDSLINKEIKIKEEIVVERDIKNKLNKLSVQLSKIGTNYNQFVKKYAAISEAKKTDGTPVINTRTTNYYFKNLEKLTLDIRDLMKQAIELLDQN